MDPNQQFVAQKSSALDMLSVDVSGIGVFGPASAASSTSTGSSLHEVGSRRPSGQKLYPAVIKEQHIVKLPGGNGPTARTFFKCSICDKTFSNSSAIAKHRLTHTDERKYVCNICNKAFKRQDHLNGHKLTHETKKPHACAFCDRSYSDARSLKRHYENTHTEDYQKWQLISSNSQHQDVLSALALASQSGSQANSVSASASNSPQSSIGTLPRKSLDCNEDDGSEAVIHSTSSFKEAAKVAMMIANPLEEPKRVTCQVLINLTSCDK
ncbi:hypothetical protein Ciccas_000869 [Cichlidogyrus casuarinus]|uniref:C2H2-type domain-containing protein n=1 Tax=Cichlidogyrus casuarinus TaxID=1844966 RepID=A0ABD2QNY0_9PLAT